ncbi:MAG: diguanylate cyclase [Candidatus Adiutrix sp.]|jgi:diguanylate cyclase (GGDEF)-like protein|nr:diguanylate cyclase [Candidatus Adiutrix sp.]
MPEALERTQPDGGEMVRQAVDFLEKLLLVHRNQAPPPGIAAIKGFDGVCEHIRGIKDILFQFSNGQFEYQLTQGGATVGYIKALQSNIRHLAWQCNRVADGDLNQRVDFMGELSNAFNRMIERLSEHRRIIEQKQEELTSLTQELRKEIKRKEEVESVLRASEEAYRQKSLHDPLTGVYNRGYFFDAATREMENLKRQPDSSACVVMIDIDHFKQYNDTYGHLMGDQVIKNVTGAVGRTLRKSDILARYGGEEFVLLLNGADLETGLAIAERIRGLVEAQPNPAGAETPPVTISLGLCCVESRLILPYSPGPHILFDALTQADAALYTSKENGRNQVSHSPGFNTTPG